MDRCIYSVLEQTYDYYEIILINDGATDASGVICERYAKIDERIKVYHQANQGLIMTRRNGIELARGDYYLFLDSDDYWDTDLLETISKAIWTYNCDMVIFNYRKITPNNIYLAQPVFEDGSLFDCDNKDQIFEEVIKGSRLNQLWIKAVKYNIVDYRDYSKYKKVKHAEDLLQSLPLLWNAKRILYLDKAMYNYRMNPTSITNNFNVSSIKDITIVRKVVLKYMELMNMTDNQHLQLFYQNYVNSVLMYLSDLSCSKTPNVKKKNIMDQTQTIHLYKDALNYIDKSKFSPNKKIQFYLFKKKFYGAFVIYNKVIQFIENIVN